MTRPPLANTIASLLGVIAFTPAIAVTIIPTASNAAPASTVQSTADREVVRRQDRSERIGRDAIAAGEKALSEKDYEKAFAEFKLACDNIPVAPKSNGVYHTALKNLCESGVKFAEQRIAEGRYQDAENTLKLILDPRYDSQCKAAVVLMARLETPGYFNKTITPKSRGNVEEVKKLMIDADGYYQSGRYDLSFQQCEKVLNIDRYNIAARKMQEKINLARINYANTAYDETRSRAVWKVDNAWQNPVRKFNQDRPGVLVVDSTDTAGTAKITAKLNRIIIPKLEFKDATIREAIDFLKKKSVDLDSLESDQARRGVNIVLKLDSLSVPGVPAAAPVAPPIPGIEVPGEAVVAVAAPALGGAPLGAPSDARITLNLSNIPLAVALTYVTSQANLKYKVEQYAVSIVPISTPTETILTKEYKVPPGFIVRKTGGAGDGGGITSAVPPDATKGGSSLAVRQDAKAFLVENGVAFPPGGSATYLAQSSRMIVRNTQENLEMIDILVASGTENTLPAQVEIEAKFVEITQSNLKELSFDWLLGAFNIGKGGNFGAGGTPGTGPVPNPSDFPFQTGGTPIGQNIVTSGNRSGGTALTATAIDALLFGTTGASKAAPAIAALAGVFTDPQFQVVIRALNQKKGVDLLSAPRVTAKSGQKALIEVIREFRYPTEFDPPQIPQTIGSTVNGNTGVGGALGFGSSQSNSFPVTPTTPTGFETRNTGVTLEVDPTIGPDGYTIDLNLVPQVVEFEGFINYGSPIQTSSTNPITGLSTINVLTPNTINQPIFSTRKVTTSVSILDGSTVVLGGLMREDIQKIEDKVPLLGDIPLVGRLFRSSVDQHLKRNLVIFVSARLINPAGDPVHSDEEQEEIVETLPLTELPAPDLLPLMPK